MSILGNRVLRKEDPRFLRGEATYVENLPLEGARTVTFVRSPFAHARITGIDASAAEALPNIEVLTGADFDGVAMGAAADPRARAAAAAADRRQGRRALRRRHRGHRPQRRPSIRRGRRRARRRRVRPAAGAARSGRGCEGRAAALPGRRHEHRGPGGPHGSRPDAVRGLRRRRLGRARQPAHGRLPARGALGRGRADGRQGHRLALDAGAAPGPPRPLPDARARSARAADHRAGRRRRLRREGRVRRRGGDHRLAGEEPRHRRFAGRRRAPRA